MRHFGLIGKTLAHSFSKAFFDDKFATESIDADYQLLPIPYIGLLPDLILSKRINGLNVTIPYKEEILPFLDSIDENAKEIGAVNVVKITFNGNRPYLQGFNSDAVGFKKSILPLLKPWHKNVLVLGTGGASKAVVHALGELGMETQYVSRTKSGHTITYAELTREVLEQHTLIVNTTPLGTFPNINQAPDIPYNLLTKKHLLFDLVYNPAQTLFLANGIKFGAETKNGYEMLVEQANESWRIWNRK